MANTTTIILKNSGSTGNIPSSANLQFGEVALNYADGILYYKNPSNQVLSISGSGGGGSNVANAAYEQANIARIHANAAYISANAAYDLANTKYTQNSKTLLVQETVQFTSLGGSFIRSNGGFINVISNNFVQLQYNPNSGTDPYNSENTSWVTVDGGGVYIETNDSPATGNYAGVHLIRDTSTVKIFSRLNTFTFSANTLTFPDNTSQSTAYDPNFVQQIFAKANIANTTAVSAFLQANAGFLQANTANVNAILAYSQANVANTTAVSAFLQANAGFLQANTANVNAILAFGRANTANTTAVAAFVQANSVYSAAVLKTGNTMTGQLIVSAGIGSTSQNTGSIVVNGGVGISGNVYISNSSSYGFANTTNISVAKIQYNAACNSIDFVFG
jgi:hypothetical protein